MKERYRYLLLATINGAISFLTLATLERVQILKLELRDHTEPGVGYVLQRTAFWTWPIVFFHVFLFIVAALLVRRYFVNLVGVGLLFWLAIAAIVCVAWLFAAMPGIAFGPSDGVPVVERILQAFPYRASQQTALDFGVAVFGVNLVFGAVVQLAGNHSWRKQLP